MQEKAPYRPSQVRTNDVLAELCRAIVRKEEPAPMAQDVADRLQRYFGTASVGFWWVQDDLLRLDGLSLEPPYHDEFAPVIREEYGESARDSNLPGSRAIEERAVLRFRAGDADLPPGTRELLEGIGVKTLLCIPIFLEADPVGVGLIGVHGDRPLTAADELLLEDALGILAIAYHRAHLRQRLDEGSERPDD